MIKFHPGVSHSSNNGEKPFPLFLDYFGLAFLRKCSTVIATGTGPTTIEQNMLRPGFWTRGLTNFSRYFQQLFYSGCWGELSFLATTRQFERCISDNSLALVEVTKFCSDLPILPQTTPRSLVPNSTGFHGNSGYEFQQRTSTAGRW